MTQTRNSFIQRTFTFRSTSLHKSTILFILLTQDPLTNRFPFHLTSIVKNHRFIHLFNQRIIFTRKKEKDEKNSQAFKNIIRKNKMFQMYSYLNYTYSKVRINRSMKNFLFLRSRIFEIIVPARYS